MNKDIMLTLKLATVGQLMLELLEQFERLPQNRQKKKNLIKQLIPELEKDTVQDFNKAFQVDENTLMIIQQSYDATITDLAKRDIPSVVIQRQMWDAYFKEPNSMEANIHRILKKA